MQIQNLLKKCKKAFEYRIASCKRGGCTYEHPCPACKGDNDLIEEIIYQIKKEENENTTT